MVDVEFEWFDPQPEHDFQGLKTLLRQLFDADAQLFDLSALTDLILAQPLLGSTVKVEGNETDPYAFLTVLNLHEHTVSVVKHCYNLADAIQDKLVIKSLIDYIIRLTSGNPNLSVLMDLLKPKSKACIGLLLSERLINIPSEVVPPMYKMLLEEISWALEEKEPYSFTHYLVLSKTYKEVSSNLDQEPSTSQKKRKKQKMASGQRGESSVFHFHPEDEVLQRHASAYGGFNYLKQEAEGHSDSKRAFQDLGIKPQGHLILIEKDKLQPAVRAMEEYFHQS